MTTSKGKMIPLSEVLKSAERAEEQMSTWPLWKVNICSKKRRTYAGYIHKERIELEELRKENKLLRELVCRLQERDKPRGFLAQLAGLFSVKP